MRDFTIMSDANCDLPEDLVRRYGIRIVPMLFGTEGRTYTHSQNWEELSPTEFYSNMRDGCVYTTIPLDRVRAKQYMLEEVMKGNDILWISFSSALSSTYSAVIDAAQEVRQEYQDAKVLVVDSLSACMGQGMLLYLCAKEKDNGADIEATRAYAEATKLNIVHWFTVDNLNYLRRGGRIGATTVALGNIMSVKPVLKVDNGGRLCPAYNARGHRSALSNLINQLELTMANTADTTIFLGHADCKDDADFMTQEIMTRFPNANLVSGWIGPNIGTHVGPGTLALFFIGEAR